MNKIAILGQPLSLKQDGKARDVKWTENIAVGSKEFVKREEGRYELHDPQRPYGILEHFFHGGIFSTLMSSEGMAEIPFVYRILPVLTTDN